jgi:putative Mg2+ transporter-C (MgtC) family protein
VWVVAAIGMTVGGGPYLAAAITTVFVLLILAVMKPLERRLTAGRRRQQLVEVVLDSRATSVDTLRGVLARFDAEVERMHVHLSGDHGKSRVDLVLKRAPPRIIELLDALSREAAVHEVRSNLAASGGGDARPAR